MKLYSLVRILAAFFNAILLLMSLFSLFTGHAAAVVVLGSISLLNFVILFGDQGPAAHPGRTRGLSALSILGNLHLVWVGTGLLQLNKGPTGLWGGYGLMLAALLGFYFAVRRWKEASTEMNKSPLPEPAQTFPEEQQVDQNFSSQNSEFPAQEQLTSAEKTWKTYLFNTENPSLKTVISTISMFLFLGFCLWAMGAQTFFPSASWRRIGNILALIFIIPAIIFSVKLLKTRGIKTYSKNGIKINPLLSALVLPPAMWLMFKVAIVLGIGHAYTELQGRETSMIVPVEKTSRTYTPHHRYSSSPTLYCLDSEKLQRGFMSDLCIKKTKYDSMPHSFSMLLVGKQSYFGFVYDKYALEDPQKIRIDENHGSVNAQLEYDLAVRCLQGDGLPKNYEEAARHLRIAAEEGNAHAQFLLGVMHISGEGVEKDIQKATGWLQKAANQDSKDAQRQLGLMYMNGIGVEKNTAEAEKLIRAAAEQGDAKAQFILGTMLIRKEPRDPREIKKWLTKAAEQGITEAQTALGMLLFVKDPATTPDPVAGAKWLRMAADKGDATAQERLAALYMSGDGVPRDMAEAAKLFQKSAEQDHEKAQMLTGLLYASGQGVERNLTEAEKWFRKAAEKGNAEAQYFLGGIYAHGTGVKQDYAEAVKWLKMSAGQGNAKAQNDLGDSYEKGNGVAQDFSEALKLYQKAASQGLPIAYNGIGDIYRLGEGVTQDYSEAEKWYRKAAENGFPEAQFRLGQFYGDGTGIAQNHENAYFWLTLAANGGFKDASIVRDSAASHLTEQQVSDIQKRINDWKPIKSQPLVRPATETP